MLKYFFQNQNKIFILVLFLIVFILTRKQTISFSIVTTGVYVTNKNIINDEYVISFKFLEEDQKNIYGDYIIDMKLNKKNKKKDTLLYDSITINKEYLSIFFTGKFDKKLMYTTGCIDKYGTFNYQQLFKSQDNISIMRIQELY